MIIIIMIIIILTKIYDIIIKIIFYSDYDRLFKAKAQQFVIARKNVRKHWIMQNINTDNKILILMQNNYDNKNNTICLLMFEK